MQADLKLFNEFEQGSIPSTLRIYSWKPKCISFGHSQEIIKMDGWDIVKRPTGGGTVFHNEAEVTYSLVTDPNNPTLPKGMIPSYKKISEAVVNALNSIKVPAEIRPSYINLKNPNSSLCFAYPAEYEVVVDGKKIVGSAQKRGKKTLLQQGSIFVKRTEIEGFSENAISIEDILGRKIGFNELKAALTAGFSKILGIQFS